MITILQEAMPNIEKNLVDYQEVLLLVLSLLGVVVLVAASIAAIMLRKPSPPIDNSTVVGLKSTDNL